MFCKINYKFIQFLDVDYLTDNFEEEIADLYYKLIQKLYYYFINGDNRNRFLAEKIEHFMTAYLQFNNNSEDIKQQSVRTNREKFKFMYLENCGIEFK